jgi:hypothetical protein
MTGKNRVILVISPKDVPFEKRAGFKHDSLSRYLDSSEFAQHHS